MFNLEIKCVFKFLVYILKLFYFRSLYIVFLFFFFYFRRDSRSPDDKSRSPSREKNGDASPQSGDD